MLNMAFELKLALVLLIIHFKLHGLNAAVIVDRYKTSISDISSDNSSNSNSNNIDKNNYYKPFEGSFNEVYKINNNEIIDNATSSVVRTTTQVTNASTNTTYDYWQLNNKHLQLLPFANSSSIEDFFVADTADNAKSIPKQTRPLCDNDGKDISSSSNCNILKNDTNLNKSDKQKSRKSKPKSEIVHKTNSEDNEVLKNMDNNISSWEFLAFEQRLNEPATNETGTFNSSEIKTAEAEGYYNYNLIQNVDNQAQGAHARKTANNGELIKNATSSEDAIASEGAEHTLVDHDEWDPQGLFNDMGELVNAAELEKMLRKYKKDLSSHCIMDGIRSSLLWWAHGNGTLNFEILGNKILDSKFSPKGFKYLDFSHRNFTNDDELYNETFEKQTTIGAPILIFSAAKNNLKQIPFRTLKIMRKTLRFLTLEGNNFSISKPENLTNGTKYPNKRPSKYKYDTTGSTQRSLTGSEIDATSELSGMQKAFKYRDFLKVMESEMSKRKDEGDAWATFPIMSNLIELDISHCKIEYIAQNVFQNITGLRKLFMSHNQMVTIPHDAFNLLPDLEYLDLSFTNLFQFDYKLPRAKVDGVWSLINGVKIQAGTFKDLNKLIYLDISHTTLTRNSAVAFTHLGPSLKYMSLCYTSFPMVGNALLKNTGLIGLDLSGNPYAAFNFIDDAFEGIADSLKYLFFQHSNVHNLEWLKPLKNLSILSLARNNINDLSSKDFSHLKNLNVLDLSSNNIGNWYSQAFASNTKLRVINLHNNKINMINYEMLQDFKSLEFLSLGENNFICDCILRNLLEDALFNSRRAKCMGQLPRDVSNLTTEQKLTAALNTTQFESFIPLILFRHYTLNLKSGYEYIHKHNMERRLPHSRLLASATRESVQQSVNCTTFTAADSSNELDESALKFELVDFEEEHYWCFNDTTRVQLMQFDCQVGVFAAIENNINKLTRTVVASTCSIVAVTLLIVIVYLKRWHIYYYYSSLKSAALLSVATKDQVKKFNELAESDPSMVYDIFISYCQSDRDWVLTELLPNVEDAGNISICLHERDFEIGVAILENIISCMDRSRALMLIISSNFLLSHWCQFEMHLAQHRIFEVSKEHLIIVFLEDIPRNKRPKTLQYLMEVKTYIKWPGVRGREIKLEERRHFWKRLHRSLEQIGIATTESQA